MTRFYFSQDGSADPDVTFLRNTPLYERRVKWRIYNLLGAGGITDRPNGFNCIMGDLLPYPRFQAMLFSVFE